MTYREFVRHVRRAYARLPENVLRRLENVDIVVEEWPGPDEAGLMGEHDTLFGLYHGWPLTEREGHRPAAARPYRHLPPTHIAGL